MKLIIILLGISTAITVTLVGAYRLIKEEEHLRYIYE